MVRQTTTGQKIGAVLIALFALVVGILAFPTVQTIGYGLLVGNPETLWWGTLSLIGAGLVVRSGFHHNHPTVAIGLLVLGVLMTFIIGPYLGGVYAQQDILQNQDFEQRAELPDSSTEHVRVLPRNVADSYAESANQLPKYSTGDSDIAYRNGEYTWSYPVEPGRLVVQITGNQWGAYYVNMEQTERDVVRVNQPMENGQGQLFIDSFAWQTNLAKIDAAHAPDTTFNLQHENESYIAKSYVNHKWGFRLGPIPQLYAVPHYGGTLVMDSNGNIEDYSPSEVASSDLFAGQNTYPYGLTRFRMKAMQLRNGLLNKWFVGEGVPQIADTGGFSDNEQPFVVPANGENGTVPDLQYMIAATPAGAGDGIYQLYQIDGQTGDISYVEFDDTRTAPQKAAGYTRSQDREPNWAANNEDGSTQITEPIPVVVDGRLYWHMRVTPTDGSKVSYTTFVDATSGDVYRADTTQEIVSFISGDDAPALNETDSDGTQGVFTVRVIDNGTVVDTLNVTANQSVEISPTTGNQTGVAG